ncbi:S24 family peptidase [Sulfurimonas sp.]|uniref:S24 family peptidase n=1 Tax=Sulfurimonas sp. TaxID=2022749 RepID=UPI0025EBED5A|nr:S24 family peptidase [Sulfurimonas sp.]
MLNYKDIIEKLKNILSKELGNKKIFDKDIALSLGIDYDNFRKQKTRNHSIPYYEIMSFLAKRNISINWFFFNQLPESLIDSTSNYIIVKYQNNILASTGGGSFNYECEPIPLIIDKTILDHINSSYKYTEVLKSFGESMEPDIRDDSLVFIDKNQINITKDGIFAINTNNGLFLKNIELKNDKIILKSSNKLYKDIYLHVNEVHIIGRVCGVFLKV